MQSLLNFHVTTTVSYTTKCRLDGISDETFLCKLPRFLTRRKVATGTTGIPDKEMTVALPRLCSYAITQRCNKVYYR